MNDLFSSLLSNRKAIAGLLVLLGFLVTSLVGPWLVQDPFAYVGVPHEPPSYAHWLGTTGQGQDVLAQLVVGSRVTLAVGFATGLLVVALGAVIGGAAGYLGGRIDDLLSVLMNVFLVMPGLPLMVVIAAWLPPGPATMIAVLSLTGWAWNARVFRAQTMSLRRKDFVAAAEVSGEPAWRIVVVEILPNMASLLLSAFIGATVYAIGAQVGLEFLGLGDLSRATWGTNLYWAANDSALLIGAWWTFVPTGLCVALTGFALTMVNFGLDEITNPRLARPTSPLLDVGKGPRSTPVRRADG